MFELVQDRFLLPLLLGEKAGMRASNFLRPRRPSKSVRRNLPCALFEFIFSYLSLKLESPAQMFTLPCLYRWNVFEIPMLIRRKC